MEAATGDAACQRGVITRHRPGRRRPRPSMRSARHGPGWPHPAGTWPRPSCRERAMPAGGKPASVRSMATAGDPEMNAQAKAMRPEDVTRLVTDGSTPATRPGWRPCRNRRPCWPIPVAGREAIRAIYQQMRDAVVTFAIDAALRTFGFEDLASTSTRSADNTGVRVQLLRRQPDGSWLRVIDRPEVPRP